MVLTVVPQRFLADLEMLKYTPTIQIQMLCQNPANVQIVIREAGYRRHIKKINLIIF